METTAQDMFVLNGMQGESVDRLAEFDHDPGVLRPFKWKGRNWVTIQKGLDDNGEMQTQTILTNAAATLTPDQWELIDSTLIPVARQRLQFVARLEAAGLRFNIPNGMATPTITYQMVSDSGQAQLNMDAIVDAQSDRPLTDTVSLPMPIAQSQFHFTTREMAVSRRSGRGSNFPIDLSQATNSARKIGELTERLFIGTGNTFTYSGGTVYGLVNFPYRSTKVLTNPTTGGWTPQVLVSELISMVKIANDNGFYGPFEVFYSPNWMEIFENDFSNAKGSDTTMERLARTKSISQFTQLDYLNRGFYDMILVQMTNDTVQVVDGMPLTPLQWDSHGGLRKEYKMMQIKVPRFYRNWDGTCGIVHGSVAE